MTSEQYIKAAIANIETKLDKEGQRLPSVKKKPSNL
jgi:hypothetical protein